MLSTVDIWMQGFIQPPAPPPTPPKFESTPPQARRKVAPPSHLQKFCYVTEVYKMKKSWKIGEKWIKINFPLRVLHVNFKIFSKVSNLNWFFAQTRKNLSLGFLLSLKIIKSFQNSIKIALIFIKIRFFKLKFAKISWKVSNFCSFPLIFRLLF